MGLRDARPATSGPSHFRTHDTCVTPVLDLDEATHHEQAVARGAYRPIPGFNVLQPTVSPRFSRKPYPRPPPPPAVGADTDAVLGQPLGYAPDRVESLRAAGVVGSVPPCDRP